MIGLTISSGILSTTGHSWSRETMERDAEGFRQSEDVTWDQLEAMDLVDLCVFCAIRPSRIYDLVKGCDVHDEEAVEYAVRVGIHRICPSLDDYAHIFARHMYRPLDCLAQAAE